MPKEKCIVENCIPTPSSCVDWNGGELPYLGICNGDSLNNLVIEIITKLKEITGEDLSSFDIDALLDICNQKAPKEVTILSILNVLKNNQICLKDFIDTVKDGLDSLFKTTGVTIDLKCYAEFDNLGNPLSINREQFDQLVIDTLCSHEGRLTAIEGNLISIQAEIDALNVISTVDELEIATCINGAILPTSVQLQNTSTEICNLETATGFPADISSALANTPSNLNTEFGLLSGWTLVPANLADNYGNLLIEIENIRQRIIEIETNCCGANCDKVKVGFTAEFSSDKSEIIIRFTAGAGTNIPIDFLDIGSTITIEDIDGNIETFTTSGIDLIANNAVITVPIPSLNTTQDLSVSVDVNLSNGALTCSKCLSKIVNSTSCGDCKVCATGDTGAYAVIVYGSPEKTVTLIPGQCVLFTLDTVIGAIIPTGNITISSTCTDFLPTPTGYKCWQFKWEGNTLGDLSDAYMTDIKIGTVEYPLADTGNNLWDTDGDFLQDSIPISVPTGLCNVLCNAGGAAVSPKLVAVEIPAYLGMPLIKWTNPSFEWNYLIPYEDVCTC